MWWSVDVFVFWEREGGGWAGAGVSEWICLRMNILSRYSPISHTEIVWHILWLFGFFVMIKIFINRWIRRFMLYIISPLLLTWHIHVDGIIKKRRRGSKLRHYELELDTYTTWLHDWYEERHCFRVLFDWWLLSSWKLMLSLKIYVLSENPAIIFYAIHA